QAATVRIPLVVIATQEARVVVEQRSGLAYERTLGHGGEVHEPGSVGRQLDLPGSPRQRRDDDVLHRGGVAGVYGIKAVLHNLPGGGRYGHRAWRGVERDTRVPRLAVQPRVRE